jgi:hypothetical protein
MHSAIAAWNSVKSIVSETVQRIAAVDETQREKIRFEIEAYEKQLKGKHE